MAEEVGGQNDIEPKNFPLFLSMSSPPQDECLLRIANFLHQHANHQNIEFEGRLGLLCVNGIRIAEQMGLKTPCLIDRSSIKGNFVSDIGLNAFKRLNHALNDFFSNVKRRNHENSNEFLNPLGTQPLDYQHFIDIDKFYDGNIRRTEAGDRKRPNFVPKVIRKTAVGALDIVLPTSMFDVRVNCKLEDPVSMQSGAYCRKIRKKDRISYRFNIWSVDLTKVDEFDEVENDQPIGHPCKTTFEFEMELLDMSSLRKAIATNDKAWTYEAANCLLTSLRQLSLLANPQVSLPSCCKVPLKRSAERHIQEDKSARQKSS